MSYFTDRWIKFAKEDTWGEWTSPTTFPNYLTDWAATTTENKNEEDLIGGSRDWRKVTWLEEGVVARWTQEMVSGKIFEYILGSTTDTSSSPVTYSPASSLPSMSIYRGLYPDENGDTISLGYYGMKVDTAEITIEQGSDVQIELNFAGKGVTLPTASAKPSLDMTVVPFSFYHSSIDVIHPNGQFAATMATRLQISVNNNLEARLSAGAQDYRPVEIREGGLQVTGRLTVGGNFGELSSIVLNRQTCTIQVYLIKTEHTIQVTLNNVTFGELPDELSGLDIIEGEFPFSARPSSGNDAIKVIEDFSGTWDSLPY